MSTPSEPIQRHASRHETIKTIPSPERAAEMIDINMRYAKCYHDGDFDGMNDCMVDTPVFEIYPQAVRITGREAVRIRSERMFPVTIRQLDPRKGPDTHRITAHCFGQDTLVHEFSNVFVLPDGTSKRCYMLAVVAFEGDKMIGERVYTDHNLAQIRDQALGADFYARPDVTQL